MTFFIVHPPVAAATIKGMSSSPYGSGLGPRIWPFEARKGAVRFMLEIRAIILYGFCL
jgi:hypothetical protein